MPSHQTSPVGPGAVGEDRVLLDRLHRVRVGLVTGAGCDAEEACLGVDGVKPPVGPNFIQAMSSPTVSTVQPSSFGISIADSSARGGREGPGDVLDLASARSA